MAKVLGVSGFFFKSKDPKKLGEWYRKWLGMPVEDPYGASFKPKEMPECGCTVWAPFQQDTQYFQPSEHAYMFNLIVDDIDGALAQVKQGGAEIMEEREDLKYGKFAWFIDPEGNKVELWQPA